MTTKTRYQELMEDLNNAKSNGQDVTFIQVDGWIKAITGKITNILNTDVETVVIIDDRKEFYIDESDSIFIDDCEDKKYYGLNCKELSNWSLTIMI